MAEQVPSMFRDASDTDTLVAYDAAGDGCAPGIARARSATPSVASSRSATPSTTTPRIALALDTSSNRLCCAVGRIASTGGIATVEILAQADHECMRQANVELLATCEQVLEVAKLSWDDIDMLVVGRGPGSFTGVRIGIATAKGLSCALLCPLYGVSTLDACAWANWKAGARGRVAVMADAMRKEVYPGIYELSDTGVKRMFATESVLKAHECIDTWVAQSVHTQALLTGDALCKYYDQVAEAGFTNIAAQDMWFPSGEGLLYAYAYATDAAHDATLATTLATDTPGAAHTAALATGDPALVLPIYTRLSDAEETERRRLGMQKPSQLSVTGLHDALANRHVQLRPMSIHDLVQVAKLEAATWDGRAHTAWSEQAFLDVVQLVEHSWWVAHDEGEIIGFAGGRLAGDDFEVLDLVVCEKRRRAGIATKLIQRLAYDALMLNAQQIVLEADAGDLAACAFYSSLGFNAVAVRRNYYGQGQDAALMKRALPLLERHATCDDQVAPAPSVYSWPPHIEHRSQQSIDAIRDAGGLILAIESSCDETAAAIIDSHGTVIASKVATQIDFHARFGGVVPEIASRKHVEAIVGVYEAVMAEAGAHFGCTSLVAKDLSCVGVTYGPGLVGALVVGVAFAKGVCAAAQLPLVGVNHLEGHLFANLLATPDLQPPFVASLVSGGNTMLVHVRDWGDYHIMGETIDDAAGEAFDKVAKALGLGYPGGPVISRLAAQGNPKAINFPRAMISSGDYRFSLSGLKTSVMTYIEREQAAGRPIHLPNLAASFEAAVIDVQVAKALAAVKETAVSDFCVGGGVASNPQLRQSYIEAFSQRGVRVTIPSPELCTDNAIMIALVARRLWKLGKTHDLSLDACARLSLEVAE